MKTKKCSAILFAVTALLASSALSKPSSASKMTIAAGELKVEHGELYLNDKRIFREQDTYLYDLGEAGVLVEGYTGGQRCSLNYQIIDPESGDFRSLRDADLDTIFAECQRLQGIASELGIVIMAPTSPNEYGRVHTWDGRTMVETVLARIDDETATFGGGDEVSKWIGQDAFDYLEDAGEANRLKTVLSNEELEYVRDAFHTAGTIQEEDGYILVTGFNNNFSTWAAIAVRISDGLPFVVWDDGLSIPEGETLPKLLERFEYSDLKD